MGSKAVGSDLKMDPIITLPVDFVTSSLAYIGQIFTDLSGLAVVVIGIPLAFYVARRVIGLVRAR